MLLDPTPASVRAQPNKHAHQGGNDGKRKGAASSSPPADENLDRRANEESRGTKPKIRQENKCGAVGHARPEKRLRAEHPKDVIERHHNHHVSLERKQSQSEQLVLSFWKQPHRSEERRVGKECRSR